MKRFSTLRGAAVLGILGVLGASIPVRGESELLRVLVLEAEGGYVFPQGNLARIFDPAPEFGLRVVSSYFGPMQAHMRFQAERLDGAESPAPVWYAAGGVGLEYRPAQVWLPAPGIGISLNYGRVMHSDEGGDETVFIRDGESEFGFYPSLRWRFRLGGAWFLVADVREDVVLTKPRYSRMLATHVGAGWRWK